MELKRRNLYQNFPVCLLLIVPYGIETIVRFKHAFIFTTFNRTLWN